MPGLFLDYWYLILVVPALLISLWAQVKVKSTFKKYSSRRVGCGMTGADASRRIQQANGIAVGITGVAGSLTDHYDPRTNMIALSQDVLNCPSVAAVGVAAHETGHALQHASQYAPVRLRTAMVPVTNICSTVSPYLVIAGLLTGYYPLAYIGVVLFSVAVFFQLVTLPVEFDASHRAVAALESGGCLTEEELSGVRKVLTAAALTYVAALLVSLMSLLRLILVITGRRRNR